MDFKLILFLQFIVLGSSKIELKLPQVYEDVNEAPSNVNKRVWRQPQMDLKRWRYTQQQNADMLNLINVVGKKKREIKNLFGSPPLYLIQEVPVNVYHQPKYQIEMLNGLIGKTPQVQLQGLQQILEMDKPITENLLDVANPRKQPNIQVDDYQQQRHFNLFQEQELQVEPKSELVYQPATEASVTKKDGNVSIKNSAKSRKKRGTEENYYYEYEVMDDNNNNDNINSEEVIYEYVYEDDGGDKKDLPVQKMNVNVEPEGAGVVMEKYVPMGEGFRNPSGNENSMQFEEGPSEYETIDNQLLALLEKRKRLQYLKKLEQETRLLEQTKQKVSANTFAPMVIKRYNNQKPIKSQGSSSIRNPYLPIMTKHLNMQNLKNRRATGEKSGFEDSEAEEADVYSTIQEEYISSVEDKRPVNLIVINNSNDNHKSKETKTNDHSKTEIVKKVPIEIHTPPVTVVPVIQHVPKIPHHYHHKHHHKHHHQRPYHRRISPKKSSRKRILTKLHNAFIKFGR